MTHVKWANPGMGLLGAVLLAPFILFGFEGSISHFIGSLVIAIYLILLIINFEVGFLALIFIRSALDYFKNFGAAGGLNIAGVASLVLIVLGIFYALYRKINVFKFEDSIPFFIFLVLCGISVIGSSYFAESLSDWLRLVSVFSVYVLTRMIFVSEQKIRTALIAVLFSTLLPILAGVIQFVTKQGMVMDGEQARIVGTFLHPNAFASYLLIILIFSMAQVLEGTNFINSSLIISLMIPAFAMFLFTFSRGAWIVFILAMVFMGFMRYRKLLGLLPVVLILSALMVPGIHDRIINIFHPSQYVHGRSAWEWRLDTWAAISPIIAQKPLLGHGLATIEGEFKILAHNDYLRMLAEVGVVGLLAYLYLTFSLFLNTWKAYHAHGSKLEKSFQVGLLAIIVGFLVREFADNTLRNTVVMIYFWIFVGLVRNITQLKAEGEFKA